MGIQIRTFEGKIAEDKGTSSPEIRFNYNRVVFPWSKAGKDIKGEVVTGDVPTLSEVVALLSQSQIETEFSFATAKKEDGPKSTATIVGFLVDGYNRYLSQSARSEAVNSEASVMESMVQLLMKKRNLNRDQAIAKLRAM